MIDEVWPILSCLCGGVAGGAFYWLFVRNGYRFDPKWLPALLMTIDFAAAVGYGVTGGLTEWRKVVYWLAAGILTYTVTW